MLAFAGVQAVLEGDQAPEAMVARDPREEVAQADTPGVLAPGASADPREGFLPGGTGVVDSAAEVL